jgi:hypothetical protein
MNLLNKYIFLFAVLFASLTAFAQDLPLSQLREIQIDNFKLLKLNTLIRTETGKKPQIYLNEYELKKENFSNSYLFKGLISGAVALGVTAAYFKVKADNRFDSYNMTNDKKYLDETKKFDWISGVSFAALQINLGFLIYYFLIE